MIAKSILIDSSNFDHSTTNEIVVQNINVGIDVIKNIQLVHAEFPSYLLDDNALKMDIKLSDLNEKTEPFKKNDTFTSQEIFAKIKKKQSIRTYVLDNAFENVYFDEKILGKETHIITHRSIADSVNFYCDEIVISLSVSHINDVSVQFSSDPTLMSYSFFPGVRYEINYDGIDLSVGFPASTNVSDIDQNFLKDCLVLENGKWQFYIPKDHDLKSDLSFLFIFDHAVYSTVECGHYISIQGGFRFTTTIQTNSKSYTKSSVYQPSKMSSVILKPNYLDQLSDASEPVFFNKRDAVNLNFELNYISNVPFPLPPYSSFSISKARCLIMVDYVDTHVYHLDDLKHLNPFVDANIRGLNALSIRFFDKSDIPISISKYDNVSLNIILHST